MMTHQPDSDTPAPSEIIAREAEQEAFAAVQRIALQAGAQIVEEPLAYSPSTILRRVDAVTGLRAARRLELAARRQLLNYIKHARQGGICWHEIGAMLDLGPGAVERGISLAEAAFEFVAGPGGPQLGCVASFPWTCRACGQTISDRGPSGGHPEDDEPGHDEGCLRLAAAIAAYEDMD
jgi:hypothetical protein